MSIRFARSSDLDRMLAIYSPYVTDTTVSFEYVPPTAEEFARRFDTITAQFPWLVWEQAGQILGYAYACAPFERSAYRWCAEASIYLAPEAQRKGIGTKLYCALEQVLILQGYQVVYALVTQENRVSMAFHQAMGYRHLADFPNSGFKFGRWLGVTWLEKRLQKAVPPAAFPQSVSFLVENSKNSCAFLDTFPLF